MHQKAIHKNGYSRSYRVVHRRIYGYDKSNYSTIERNPCDNAVVMRLAYQQERSSQLQEIIPACSLGPRVCARCSELQQHETP